MTMSHRTTFPHIVRVPGVVGGEPVIEGTRVSVRSIVLYFRAYKDVDRIRQAMPHLSVDAIREALAYYDAHREEIDRYIAEDEAENGLDD